MGNAAAHSSQRGYHEDSGQNRNHEKNDKHVDDNVRVDTGLFCISNAGGLLW